MAFTLVAFILVVAFAAIVWPTRYRAVPVSGVATPQADMTILAAREDRLTHAVEFLVFPIGWVSAGGPASRVDAPGDSAGDSLAALARKYGRPKN